MTKVNLLLKGKALDLAKQIHDASKTYQSAHELLQREYRERHDRLCREAHVKSKALWADLCAETGVDPDLELEVDTDYLDAHGTVFLIEQGHNDDEDDDGEPEVVKAMREAVSAAMN